MSEKKRRVKKNAFYGVLGEGGGGGDGERKKEAA